jgi:endonuclease III
MSAAAVQQTSVRVLRAPIGGFDELTGRAATDHAVWRSRRVAVESRKTQGADGHVDRVASRLLDVTRQLDAIYSTPDLGNKVDAVDELVYIILSRRTREGAYQAAYDALKNEFPNWEALAASQTDAVAEVISFSGLATRKARSLKGALGSLVSRFGRCTLEPTSDWTDDEVYEFLCGLPEIGPKSAACVMMCSLDRPAFPVDAHVGRVMQRLAIFRDVGVELEGSDHKFKQAALWDLVPPSLRYPLHVNMLVHGRLTCVSRRPRCESCPLREDCAFASAATL